MFALSEKTVGTVSTGFHALDVGAAEIAFGCFASAGGLKGEMVENSKPNLVRKPSPARVFGLNM